MLAERHVIGKAVMLPGLGAEVPEIDQVPASCPIYGGLERLGFRFATAEKVLGFQLGVLDKQVETRRDGSHAALTAGG